MARMLVLVRNPVGAGLSLLAVPAFVAFALSTLEGEGGGAGDGDRRVREIRASSAPLIASDLAGFQERMRREGRGYAPGAEAA